MKGQAVIAYALVLLLILFIVLAILALLGAAAPGQVNMPAPVTTGKYPDPVSLQVQEEGGTTMVVNQQVVDYLAMQTGATAAQVVASLNSLAAKAGLVQAGEQAVTLDTEGRLTHLLKDVHHITAWLVIKMVLRANGDVEVYHCPATGEYCNRYAVVVRDEWGQLCAVAFIKADDGKLITSFYRGCAALLEQITTRLRCKRVFHVRFVIP
jgi:hypothetical protein